MIRSIRVIRVPKMLGFRGVAARENAELFTQSLSLRH